MNEDEYIDKIMNTARQDNLAVISMLMCPVCEMYEAKLKPRVLTIPFAVDGKQFNGMIVFICEDCKEVDIKKLCRDLSWYLKTKLAKVHI